MKPEILALFEEGRNKYPMIWSPTQPSDEEIHHAERSLGVTFDADYRSFLRRFGAGIVSSETVIGIGRAEAMGNSEASVIIATQRFRAERWPGVESWYVISIDGRGNPIGVDPSGIVYISDHDLRRVGRLYGSFEEWIEKWCLRRKS